MSEKTLGKARGLNSIADPSDFKGSRGSGARRPGKEPAPDEEPVAERPATARAAEAEPIDGSTDIPSSDADSDVDSDRPTTAPPTATTGTAPSSVSASVAGAPRTSSAAEKRSDDRDEGPAPRKRRELTIPVPVSDALVETGINPADIVMRAYRNHADAIYAGTGGRLVSRGRERLRLSVTDVDFAKITRLGKARGWNRSETVAVLLTLELLGDLADAG